MNKVHSSVEDFVVESEWKVCSKCNATKLRDKDFYRCKGLLRRECKACTISKNIRYQRKIKAWKNKFVDGDEQRSYMVEYYRKNREKFAEYRRKFKEKYPDYYREYNRKRKEEKNARVLLQP